MGELLKALCYYGSAFAMAPVIAAGVVGFLAYCKIKEGLEWLKKSIVNSGTQE